MKEERNGEQRKKKAVRKGLALKTMAEDAARRRKEEKEVQGSRQSC